MGTNCVYVRVNTCACVSINAYEENIKMSIIF